MPEQEDDLDMNDGEVFAEVDEDGPFASDLDDEEDEDEDSEDDDDSN